MRKIHFADHLEKSVAEFLESKNINFIHESEGAALDFYLPDHKIHIEVKQYHTDRTLKQLSRHGDVILIQGKNSVKFLNALLLYPIKGKEK